MESLRDGLRQRKGVTKAITEFDAFPKIPETYQETSTSGGTVSILTFLFITLLVLSEFKYYSSTFTEYSFGVDKGANEKLSINIDITVAMECDDLGADILDVSGSSMDTQTQLKMEPTYFALTETQKIWFRALNSARGSDEGYRTINNVALMKAIFGDAMPTYMPQREEGAFPDKEFDACRVHGSVLVNKVAGNFHFTAGKSIPHPRGHAHLSSLVSELNYNFSHRIDKLSFGESHPGIMNPLDGDLLITEKAYHMFQYYIKVVPTNIATFSHNMTTNQYSVTQRSREIQHSIGSHGVPGIFFKYDLHPISVNVIEKRREFSQFLIRLCGIIGGVFATSGMLHSFIGFLSEFILARLRRRRQVGDFVSQTANTGLSQSAEPSISFVPPSDSGNFPNAEPSVSFASPSESVSLPSS